MFTYKRFLGSLVFIVSILTVNLLSTYFFDYLLTFKHLENPWKVTMIGMFALVLVLYPAFMWIDDLSEKVTMKYFKAGKSAAGKFFGVLLAFSVAFFVLFVFYFQLWFGFWVWQLI